MGGLDIGEGGAAARPVVRVEDIRRYYQQGSHEVRALEGVSLSICAGAVIVPNTGLGLQVPPRAPHDGTHGVQCVLRGLLDQPPEHPRE